MCQAKTAVLDWNGTLLNDLPLVYRSVCQIFSRYGLPSPTLTEYRTEMSQEWMKFYLRHGIPEGTKPEELNAIRREFLEAHWNDVELHPRALQFLQLLRKRKMKTFLVTGEIKEVVERRLSQFHLVDFFDEVVAGAYRKAEILKGLDLLPNESVFVDDDPFGICSAKELGFTTIGMTHGYASVERIRDARPHFMSNDFSGVIGYLKAAA